MRDFLSERVKSIPPSGIRKFFDIAAEMKDCLSLGVGEPDFITPQVYRDAAIKSINEGKTQYTANRGLIELREQIAKYLKLRINVDYDPRTELCVTVGASEALEVAIKALLDPGDEMLIPQPSFVCYAPIVTMASGVPHPVVTLEEDKFKVTPQTLKEAITPKSKVLLLSYPNNPTGGIMTKEDLEKLVPIIIENDLIVIADEIYGELTYGKEHASIASFPGMRERTIVINGFSKAFAMTGWRVGYFACPADISAAMVKLHQYAIMSAPTAAQYAALEALKTSFEEDFATVKAMAKEYNERRQFLVESLNAMGLHTFEPEGAFYVFPCVRSTGMTGDEFAMALLDDQKVAVVPGSAFGECGRDFVRISYAYSMQRLQEAMRRIEEFCKKHRK